jgi:RND superfamily putative drug exporter
MLDRLARFVIRRRRAVLVGAFLFLVAAALAAGGVTQRLSSGGFERGDSESAQASRTLTEEFGSGTPNLVLLVSDTRGVDHPSVVAAGTALTRELAADDAIVDADSYWTVGLPDALRSGGGDKALILARIAGDEDEVMARLDGLRARYEGAVNGLDVRLGGPAAAADELVEQTEQDLIRAEIIIFPITLLALILVFRGVVAAALPLAVGAVAAVGALAALWLLAGLTDVSVFALNVVTALGLGLAIDYSLLIVSRYRDELRARRDVDEAIIATVRTAGRTVLFASVTIACALSSLLVFPIYFLRSFGYAGLATTLVAATASVIVLPALLRVIGTRIDRLPVFPRRQRPASGSGFWYRIATVVMRRPLPIATTLIVVLLVLGSPFLGLRLGLSDERTLPASANAAQVGQVLRTEFPSRESEALQVVAAEIGPPELRAGEITGYAERISRLPAVARVDAPTGSFAGGARIAPPTAASDQLASPTSTYLQVVADADPYSPASEQLVRDLRALDAPFEVAVGGPAANYVDSVDAMRDNLPAALLILVGATLVLLFLMTGSVVLALTAVLLSLLSLTASFGAMVWVFQEGHLQWLVGDFTVTGTITFSVPVMLFSVAFGLSTDYGVFLLSRIREEYNRIGDTASAVAVGLERSGRIITAAAAIIALVFLSFVPSGVTYMKIIGLGLALAVIMDATLIRGAILPAFVRLTGRASWWAPGWLRAVHERFALREAPPEPSGDRTDLREEIDGTRRASGSTDLPETSQAL